MKVSIIVDKVSCIVDVYVKQANEDKTEYGYLSVNNCEWLPQKDVSDGPSNSFGKRYQVIEEIDLVTYIKMSKSRDVTIQELINKEHYNNLLEKIKSLKLKRDKLKSKISELNNELDDYLDIQEKSEYDITKNQLIYGFHTDDNFCNLYCWISNVCDNGKISIGDKVEVESYIDLNSPVFVCYEMNTNCNFKEYKSVLNILSE